MIEIYTQFFFFFFFVEKSEMEKNKNKIGLGYHLWTFWVREKPKERKQNKEDIIEFSKTNEYWKK